MVNVSKNIFEHSTFLGAGNRLQWSHYSLNILPCLLSKYFYNIKLLLGFLFLYSSKAWKKKQILHDFFFLIIISKHEEKYQLKPFVVDCCDVTGRKGKIELSYRWV